jgi:hypothetical protein
MISFEMSGPRGGAKAPWGERLFQSNYRYLAALGAARMAPSSEALAALKLLACLGRSDMSTNTEHLHDGRSLAILKMGSVALFAGMAVVACSRGAPPIETGVAVVSAAPPSTIATGATIRFAVATEGRLRVAHLAILTADSLIVDRCTDCDRLRYGTGELNRLDVLRGSSRGRHFAVGLGVGALAGLIGAFVNFIQPCHTDVCDLRALGFFYGPPIGALIVGIVGASLPTHVRWEPVALPRAVR